VQSNADSNDEAMEEDATRKRRRLLVELGAPVKRMRVGEEGGLDEGVGEVCASDSDYNQSDDMGLSELEE
jgi:hypothetical protein